MVIIVTRRDLYYAALSHSVNEPSYQREQLRWSLNIHADTRPKAKSHLCWWSSSVVMSLFVELRVFCLLSVLLQLMIIFMLDSSFDFFFFYYYLLRSCLVYTCRWNNVAPCYNELMKLIMYTVVVISSVYRRNGLKSLTEIVSHYIHFRPWSLQCSAINTFRH